MRGVIDDTTPGKEWWRNAVVYQLYIRSFADTNGDGAGDLRGIIDNLEYLESLNIDAVWLNPCYPSPQHDHGYDVSDYFNIEPAYGTLAIFDELVTKANARGIRVLMDVVPNHCSQDHVWFQAALASPPGSAERERFYFADGRGTSGEIPPNDWQSVFTGCAWTRTTNSDGSLGQWYLHTFASEQPDLRCDHPEVLQHFSDMFRFWFDRGVDGFRVDAIIVMGKEPGLPNATPAPAGILPEDAWQFNRHTVNHPSLFPIVAEWRKTFDDYQREHSRALVSVAEAYTPRAPKNLLRYIGDDRFHQSFTFDLLLEPWNAQAMATVIRMNFEALKEAGASYTWTLNNHDSHRIVTRYGRADAHEFYSGNNLINSSADTDIALGTLRARAALLMMLALPGSAYLYMGEELGLPEVLDLPNERREDPIFRRSRGAQLGRDGCRVPMPWTNDATTGFGFTTTDTPPWLPQPADWGTYSAESQDNAPESMLTLYRAALRLRSLFVVAEDQLDIACEGNLLILQRGVALAVVNFADQPVELPDTFSPAHSALHEYAPVLASSTGALSVPGQLAGNSAAWFVRSLVQPLT
jgi:alpha-glucosidase